ncbi:CDP-diacylglycerol--glycerol-3-phosphate 3-phosphatidyltransferase [Termitidicoccus mucosus]|uniref:CDP-diacylglycerol--glycerol-3-phosphate 3-phosphatidyltransferase n=1 Tax=Termitidicoccus mucosus TaxID=1184151 RepID=A0A178IFR6_9BACT|nr:CDP-diacylglycerol--glycerol-3-phosphate 3-phosphatidyltransferase [Opitutaceae bacterium TSB47]
MKLNLPNLLTISRIPLMFFIVWLMYCKWPGSATLAFVVFVATGVSDWLDGYLARRQKLVSNFGKFMDAITDKILVIGLMVAFVEQYDSVLFLVMVLLTLCREFLVSGMRMVAATKGVVVAAERGGKVKTSIQLVAVGFLLFVPMLERDLARFLPFSVTDYYDIIHDIGIYLFVVATVLAVNSGINYLRKYRHVLDE